MKILKFYSTWCSPCHRLTQTIASIPNIPYPIVEINMDMSTDGRQYAVGTIPTCILVDDQGREIRRIKGAVTKEQFIEFIGAKQ